ncbi:MAG: DUF998 domain-containing protein [Candidatus Dormibacteria bacterium]
MTTVAVLRPEGERSRQAFIWGFVGLLAQLVFAAGWVIAETWQGPRYSPVTDTISDLQAATAPHVWFPVLCFAIGGLGTCGFALFGLRPALADVGSAAAWKIGLSCLALGNSFPLISCQLSSPGCTATTQLLSAGGLTDALLSGLALWVLAITPFPLARRVTSLPGWKSLRPVLLVAGVVTPALYGLLAIALFVGVGQGLAERSLVVVCQLWVCLLAGNLIRVSLTRRAPAS